MEMQDQSSPNPNNCNSDNDYIRNNVNSISSQHASNSPSPATPSSPQFPVLFGSAGSTSTASAVFKGLYLRRVHSDGDFHVPAADGEVGVSGEQVNGSSTMEMGSEDDLAFEFLDLEEPRRIDDNGGEGYIMGQDDGGGSDRSGGGWKKRMRSHRHSSLGEGLDEGYAPGKGMPPEKLAEMWSVDPKRVRRILANRQSAARSKERKARYLSELERQVRSLHTKASNLSAQLTIYQRDTAGLSTQNAELKIQLQVMDQKYQLNKAVIEAMKQEIERLKIANGEFKTPTDSSSFGTRHMPYSPLPSPTTLRPPVSYSLLTSSSTMQPMQCSPLPSPSTQQPVPSSPFTPVSTPLPVQYAPLTPKPVSSSPLTSESTMLPAQYSPVTSPSTVQSIPCNPLTFPSTQQMQYSPLTSPRSTQPAQYGLLTSTSTSQTMLYSKAPSSSQQTSTNFFPYARKTVPVLAPLPPKHKSRARLSSYRVGPAKPPTPSELNDSFGSLQELDVSQKGLNILNTDEMNDSFRSLQGLDVSQKRLNISNSLPVFGTENNSTAQPMTP